MLGCSNKNRLFDEINSYQKYLLVSSCPHREALLPGMSWNNGLVLECVRVVQTGLRARIGKRVGFRKDKRDLASTCKKLRPFDCPVDRKSVV